MNIVEFPGLGGLSFTINRVAFQVFGIQIYWYGIIISIGFLLAVLLGMRNSKRFGIEPDSVVDLVLYLTPAAIISARLYYVIFSWGSFKDSPIDILNIRMGGLAIYGGILGALLVAYIFTRVKKIEFLNLLDFGVPYLALAQAIGRWGNFMNQEAYGVNTTLPWGMTSGTIRQELQNLRDMGVNVDPNLPVHPTFLYESLLDMGVFLFLIWYRKRRKVQGEMFFLYMILYGVGRALIEGLRTDSLMLGNLRISQVLSVLFAITFAIVLYVRHKKAVNVEEPVEIGTSSYGTVLKRLHEDEATNIDSSSDTEGNVPVEAPDEEAGGSKNAGISENSGENADDNNNPDNKQQ